MKLPKLRPNRWEAWRHGSGGCELYCSSAQHAFGLAILSGGVRARGAKKNATCSEERSSGIVDELGAVICLKAANRQAELSVSVSNKIDNMIMNL